MTDDKNTPVRAAFEAWAYDNWQNSNPPQNAWIGWKAACERFSLSDVHEVLSSLQTYADDRTARSFSEMMAAEHDGDFDWSAQVKMQRDAYSDMTTRIRQAIATIAGSSEGVEK